MTEQIGSPRQEFTGLEQHIFADLSGEKTLETIALLQERARCWKTAATPVDQKLVIRGEKAMAAAEHIVRSVWEKAHNRSLL